MKGGGKPKQQLKAAPPKPNRQKMRDWLRGKLFKTTEERAKHNRKINRGRAKPKKRVAFL